MHNFIFFILLLFINTNAESILSRIGWKGPSLAVIIIIISIFLLVISFFLLYYIRQHLSQKKASRQLSEDLFNENVKRYKLSALNLFRYMRNVLTKI